jgi:hypothetical protein
MFEKWHEFYLLIGPSAATLIGWLFVVATLTSGLDRRKIAHGTKVYSTPTVFHLGVVVLLSALALAPDIPVPVAGAAIMLSAAGGLLYSGFVAREIGSGQLNGHSTDIWCYGVVIALVYCGIGAAGCLSILEHGAASWILAACLVALLLLAIRNSWDLVTWMAHRGSSARPESPDAPRDGFPGPE